MTNAKIIFRDALLDIQDYEPDEIERRISRIHFDFEIDGMMHRGLFSTVRQPLRHPESIEISSPFNYVGPFDLASFLEAARRYYLDLLSTQAPGIKNNRRAELRVVELDVA